MERKLTQYDECPNCGLTENRWVYQCSNCDFIGCYDEVFENGCYIGDDVEENCPKCGSSQRTLIGKAGAGSSEE
jgi:hypothetical protein